MSDLVGNPEDRFSRVAAHMFCFSSLVHGLTVLPALMLHHFTYDTKRYYNNLNENDLNTKLSIKHAIFLSEHCQFLTVIIHSSLFLCTGSIGSSSVLHAPLDSTMDSLPTVAMYFFRVPCRAFLSYRISPIPWSHSRVQWYSIPIRHTWAGYWNMKSGYLKSQS